MRALTCREPRFYSRLAAGGRARRMDTIGIVLFAVAVAALAGWWWVRRTAARAPSRVPAPVDAPEPRPSPADPPAPRAPTAPQGADHAPSTAPEPRRASNREPGSAAGTSRAAASTPLGAVEARPQAAAPQSAPTPDAPGAETAPTPEPATASPPSTPLPRAEPSREEVEALRRGLVGTRGGFVARLARLFGGARQIDPALLDELEEVLLTADVGVGTTRKLLERLRQRLTRNELGDADRVWQALREEALAVLGAPPPELRVAERPSVILVVGVNGVGKTTTIGKLAALLSRQGHKVLLAAGDTFRAAAVLQLEVWGRRTGCEVVKGKERADPGAVIFDAIRRAQNTGADVVIADTAGRLHTRAPLMEELARVGRTVQKALGGRGADEVLLVLDATSGQNAASQVAMFREALPLTGLVLTKLDGTAKGGVILGIVDEHRIPVRFVGVGERVEDLRAFDPRAFVEALFEKPEEASRAA
ncbi:MAG: signal recognition particle-docking protein FtsY [Myxococcota bacterium]|nr:signal recognition particle-docking protein FtsY [Myxococcota bacterium]MDW8361395.1 signal recognition particle-docking protein FtsY [Myxococcales bacterium]